MICKKNIIPTFFSGLAYKTDPTFGIIKADVCAYMIPNFEETISVTILCIRPERVR